MEYKTCFLLKIIDWSYSFPHDFTQTDDVFESYYDAYKYIEKMFPNAVYKSSNVDITDCFGEKHTTIFDWFESYCRGNRITIEIKPVKFYKKSKTNNKNTVSSVKSNID